VIHLRCRLLLRLPDVHAGDRQALEGGEPGQKLADGFEVGGLLQTITSAW
jgi:hypothetical protein